MTDQELIQLLREKTPAEFTPDEMSSLRDRWTQSPELREALVEHLHLESQLAGALGRTTLDIDTLLHRATIEKRAADRANPPEKNSNAMRWLGALGLVLLIGLSTMLIPKKRPAELQPKSIVDTASTSVDSQSVAELGADALKPENVPSDKSADDALSQANGTPNAPTEQPTSAQATATKPAVPAAPPVIEPWTEALARDVAPWPADSPKLTRDFKSSGHDQLAEAEARRWFSQVEGHPYTWGQDLYGQPQRRVARFQGLARLRSPWTNESMLRMTTFDVTDLTFYFWRGQKGCALRFYTRRDPHVWAAFAIERDASTPKPLRSGLLTTDNGSYVRAGTGTFDLRFQDGSLVLARGGITLLTAPMSSLPDEVYVEGTFRMRGLSIHKVAPFQSLPENSHRLVLSGGVVENALPTQVDASRPLSVAALPWAASAEMPASLLTNDDGSVTLKTDTNTAIGIASLPIGGRGLYEVIARVDSADPGTGLFLGDLDGRPLHRVGYFKDAVSQQITIGVLRPGETRETSNFDLNTFPPPYHSPHQWVKIVAGLGTLQILVSGDGRHWGHLIENPSRDLPGPVASVGLFGLRGPTDRSIRLSHLEVRELDGLTSVADHALLSKAPKFEQRELNDIVHWTHHVLKMQPAHAELPSWFNACAVATLTQAPAKTLAVPLIRRLVQIAIHSNASTNAKLRLLEDASLVCDLWDESNSKPIALNFSTISKSLESAGDKHPLTTIRPALLRLPIWTLSKMKSAWDRQAHRELMLCVSQGDWPDAWQTAQSTMFWNSGVHPDWRADGNDLLDAPARWLRSTAIENAPHLDDGSGGVLNAAHRHPLLMQWNKEAYNIRAELQSALTGQTYEDACRIVMSIGEQDGPGLLPDIDDRQLFVSLPTAVAAMMTDHPGFARMMVEKFGPLGMIRVKAAINAGDVAAMQSATLQFFGTEAAAEAHQWLGDRDLAAGRFASAEEHFLLALPQASLRQRESLQSRLQLASSLNGTTVTRPADAAANGQASQKSVALGSTTLSSEAFANIVKEISSRPSSASRFQLNAASTQLPTPLAPATYKLEPRALFDGQPGINPGRSEFRFGDPFGRQLAHAADAARLYVSNRFQVNAYALPGGQAAWAQGLGAEQGDAHAFAFAPMKPLVAGDRLFVRRLTKGGIELACLNAENGQVVWHQRHNAHILTDPVYWNGGLFALTLARMDDDHSQVEATRFDFETGVPTSSQPLIRLRDSRETKEIGERSLVAQLTLAGRLAVCTIAGTTVCFDSAGNINWLRRHSWLPKTVDELAEDYRAFAPQIISVPGADGNPEERVIVSLPGVRSVCCVQLSTGRQVWDRPIPEMRGVVKVTGSRALVDTTFGLVALSLENGSIAWTRHFDIPLEAIHADDSTVITAHRATITGTKTRPFLVWLDLTTGRELAQSQLAGVEREESQFGPLLFAAGKWFTFTGQGWKDPKRELNELIPVPGPSGSPPLKPGPFGTEALGLWLPDLPETQQADFALILPGWFPAAVYPATYKFELADARGETQILSSKLAETHDLALVGSFDIPSGKKTSLQLRIGNQPDRRYSFAVQTEGRTLFEKMIEESTSAGGWHDITVDLTEFAGRRIPLTLLHAAPKQHQTEVFWKRAVIKSE